MHQRFFWGVFFSLVCSLLLQMASLRAYTAQDLQDLQTIRESLSRFYGEVWMNTASGYSNFSESTNSIELRELFSQARKFEEKAAGVLIAGTLIRAMNAIIETSGLSLADCMRSVLWILILPDEFKGKNGITDRFERLDACAKTYQDYLDQNISTWDLIWSKFGYVKENPLAVLLDALRRFRENRYSAEFYLSLNECAEFKSIPFTLLNFDRLFNSFFEAYQSSLREVAIKMLSFLGDNQCNSDHYLALSRILKSWLGLESYYSILRSMTPSSSANHFNYTGFSFPNGGTQAINSCLFSLSLGRSSVSNEGPRARL